MPALCEKRKKKQIIKTETFLFTMILKKNESYYMTFEIPEEIRRKKNCVDILIYKLIIGFL